MECCRTAFTAYQITAFCTAVTSFMIEEGGVVVVFVIHKTCAPVSISEATTPRAQPVSEGGVEHEEFHVKGHRDALHGTSHIYTHNATANLSSVRM